MTVTGSQRQLDNLFHVTIQNWWHTLWLAEYKILARPDNKTCLRSQHLDFDFLSTTIPKHFKKLHLIFRWEANDSFLFIYLEWTVVSILYSFNYLTYVYVTDLTAEQICFLGVSCKNRPRQLLTFGIQWACSGFTDLID